jgi:hypothetical protein
MKPDRIEKLVVPILKRHLGPKVYDGVTVSDYEDHDGDPSIKIVVHYRGMPRGLPSTMTMPSCAEIHEALRARGESRFPYVDFRIVSKRRSKGTRETNDLHRSGSLSRRRSEGTPVDRGRRECDKMVQVSSGGLPMKLSQIEKIVVPILKRHLGRQTYAGSTIAEYEDHVGEPALSIVVRYRGSDEEGLSADVTLPVLRDIREALRDRGEERFPHVRFRIEEMPSAAAE